MIEGFGLRIEVDDLSGREIQQLPAEHLQGMADHSPAERIHALVRHIIETATQRGYARLSLETGSGAAFEPAHSLYLNFGFEFCGAFADYRPNPFSRFMTISLKKVTGSGGP